MSEKTCGTLMLLAFIAGLCALALRAPSPKWCRAGSVETLFTSCEKVVMR